MGRCLTNDVAPGNPNALTVAAPPMAPDPDMTVPMLDVVGPAGVVRPIADRDDKPGSRPRRAIDDGRAPARAEDRSEQDDERFFHVSYLGGKIRSVKANSEKRRPGDGYLADKFAACRVDPSTKIDLASSLGSGGGGGPGGSPNGHQAVEHANSTRWKLCGVPDCRARAGITRWEIVRESRGCGAAAFDGVAARRYFAFEPNGCSR